MTSLLILVGIIPTDSEWSGECNELKAVNQCGLRLLDGRFMVIHQAMGLPKGRPEALRYLDAFVEDLKASGFVAAALQRHGIEGALVAPAGR